MKGPDDGEETQERDRDEEELEENDIDWQREVPIDRTWSWT